MSDLRTAAQQALEALEQCGLDDTHRSYEFEHAARAALRAALEQQEQEPVARMHADGSGRIISQATYDEAQRQGGVPWSSVRRYTTPLYTHPPRREWRGLKEWEINDGRDQLPTEDLCNWSFRQGVYFAEAKLKEKNNG